MNDLSISSLDGILISTCSSSTDHINEMVSKEIPLVFFDRTGNVDIPKVMQDDYK
ncbi:MAG: hypothetical protein WD426_04260 [Anditalea sp.]